MVAIWTMRELLWRGNRCRMSKLKFSFLKYLGILLSSFCVVSSIWGQSQQGEESILPLPNWEQEEVQIFPLGGGLLPNDSRRVPNDAGLFIPKEEEHKESTGSEKKENRPLVDVDAPFLEQLDSRVAGEFVMDPGELLVGGVFEEVNRLLATQSMEGTIKPHMVLLPERHRLPPSIDMGKLARMSQMGGMTCMVIYPMGEPWRVRIFMSRKVTDVVNQDALRELAQACIRDAMRAEQAVEQLQRFVIQLCVRLTWMEREHALMNLEPEVVSADQMAESTVQAEAVTDVLEVAVRKEQPSVRKPWQEWWGPIRKWTLGGGLVIALLFGMRWLMKRMILKWKKRQENVMWTLPEVKVRPRLGGKHCGSGGAVVKY